MKFLFWEKNLALLFGFFLFLGSLFALQSPLPLVVAGLVLCSCEKKHIFPLAITFLLPMMILYQFYAPAPANKKIRGEFFITNRKENQGHGKKWQYRGILKTDEGRTACQLSSNEYHSAAYVYLIEGIPTHGTPSYQSLRALREWIPLKKRKIPLTEWSLRGKIHARDYIRTHTPNEKVAQFLIGMVTGELEERMMFKEFNSLGLSHLMAISGLHFALIAFTFHFLIGFLVPHKVRTVFLIFVLSLYFLFIGPLPSIFRAWLFSMVYLIGLLLERQPKAPNTLGIALIISLLFDIKSASSISFQLSFLATAALLLLYKPLKQLLYTWIPLLSLKEVLEKNTFFQHGYLFAAFFRDALALTLAVHIVLFPLLLFQFHTLSFSSLIYNLFFPSLACGALFLFILGCFIPGLHILNGLYCTIILKIPETPPFLFKTWFVNGLSGWMMTSYWITLFGIVLMHDSIQAKKKMY